MTATRSTKSGRVRKATGRVSATSLYPANSTSFRTTEFFATVHLRSTEAVQLVFHLGAKVRKDSPEVKIAGLRSRHNTYMSVPLIFTMISNHYPTMYGQQFRDACLAGVIIVGFLFVRWTYGKSAKVAGF